MGAKISQAGWIKSRMPALVCIVNILLYPLNRFRRLRPKVGDENVISACCQTFLLRRWILTLYQWETDMTLRGGISLWKLTRITGLVCRLNWAFYALVGNKRSFGRTALFRSFVPLTVCKWKTVIKSLKRGWREESICRIMYVRTWCSCTKEDEEHLFIQPQLSPQPLLSSFVITTRLPGPKTASKWNSNERVNWERNLRGRKRSSLALEKYFKASIKPR